MRTQHSDQEVEGAAQEDEGHENPREEEGEGVAQEGEEDHAEIPQEEEEVGGAEPAILEERTVKLLPVVEEGIRQMAGRKRAVDKQVPPPQLRNANGRLTDCRKKML